MIPRKRSWSSASAGGSSILVPARAVRPYKPIRPHETIRPYNSCLFTGPWGLGSMAMLKCPKCPILQLYWSKHNSMCQIASHGLPSRLCCLLYCWVKNDFDVPSGMRFFIGPAFKNDRHIVLFCTRTSVYVKSIVRIILVQGPCFIPIFQ